MGAISKTLTQLEILISAAEEEHIIPLLKILSRKYSGSISYNESIQLQISDLRYKAIKYPADRFDAYLVTLKEIYEGLLNNTVSKKR